MTAPKDAAKAEWIARCAKRYMERGGLNKRVANEAAEACWECRGDWGQDDTSPEVMADNDMDEWQDDGDES